MNETPELNYSALRSVSVVDAVKDWILDQLIEGNLRPGSKLPTEAELCANLGASRNSVREAIKQLEAYGAPVLYSIILQNSRWEDFVELRRAIEIGTLYSLISHAPTEEELQPLRKALEDLESAVGDGTEDVQRITEADCDFHNVIISLTGNPQLITLSEYINRITVPSREKTTEQVLASGQIDSYVRLHRQLYTIIASGDKAGIEKAVVDHYVFWEQCRK